MISKSKAKTKIKVSKKMGRPSLYIPEYCEIASRACMLGAINEELAKILGVAISTIKKWMKEKPEFLASIKKGREIADQDVAISLYKRAIGYSHSDTKAQWVETDIIKDGIPMRVGRWEYADLVKHYPPDTAAAFIWLKNRRSDLWRDKPVINDDDIPTASPVSVTIKIEDAS